MNTVALQHNATDELNKKLFELGWEYWVAKQGLPNDVADYPAFIDGYNSAKQRLIGKRADRYHLKWLQIRYGALKRNRIFDETVTPEVIKKIDVTHCPITLAPMTHSTGTGSDWSIDRVSNGTGYSIGNLVIVSTKANKAKGTMSYEDILEASEATESTNGLAPVEWQRWRFICSLNITAKGEDDHIKFGYHCAPFVSEFPQLMFMNPSAILQYAIAHKAFPCGGEGMYPKIIDGLPKEFRKRLNRLVDDARDSRHLIRTNECEIWFNRNLFKKFFNLHADLPSDCKAKIMSNMHHCNEFRSAGAANVASWNPDLKGYNL